MSNHNRPQYRGTPETDNYSDKQVAQAIIAAALKTDNGCSIDGAAKDDCQDTRCQKTCAVVQVGQAAMRLDTKRLKAERRIARLEKEARINPLSGLDNKLAFHEHAAHFDAHNQRQLESGQDPNYASIFFIDLNKFKPVNDIYGHEVGDQVICAVATQLKKQLRAGDWIYHLSGDEFAVACPTVFTDEDAEGYIGRITDAVGSATVKVGPDMELVVGATAGYAFTSESIGMVDALDLADHMMNLRKQRNPDSR